MSDAISFKARQRFRQRLHNIEDADEILDALNQFLERFTPIQGNFSSMNWETIYELEAQEQETVMVSLSVVARESANLQAGLKRTGVFYKDSGNISSVNIQQTDYTSKTGDSFNARILPENGLIKIQVKGNSNNLTRWKGSIEIEKLGE